MTSLLMARFMFRRLRFAYILTAAAAALNAACFARSEPAIPTTPPEEYRAALTELRIVNHTNRALTIAFRTTAGVRETIVGTVAAGGSAHMAPIPAGEPISLMAREPNGGEFVLAPQSFPIGGSWTWEIPATAAFRRPGE